MPSASPGASALESSLRRCLSLDLEVGRRDNRIHKIAGVRPDTGWSLTAPVSSRSLHAALARLDRLADDADFLLGHNLIAFDLPHLQAASPGLGLLRLPAVDTLRLNPLAFPATRITTSSSTTRTASSAEAASTTPSWTQGLRSRSSTTS